MTKNKLNTIVLRRMGDYFEAIGGDACILADACGLTLSRRSDGEALAGLPASRIAQYVERLESEGWHAELYELGNTPIR